MNEMMILWMVILIISIAVEALTLGLTSIWFAGGALVAVFASVLHAPVVLQVVLFFTVSLLMLFFTRPVAVKYFNKDRVKTNAEGMIGSRAIVTGEIDNLQSTGRATAGGLEWSARSAEPNKKIPMGTVVTIVAIDGVKLIVKPDPQMEKITVVSAEEKK